MKFVNYQTFFQLNHVVLYEIVATTAVAVSLLLVNCTFYSLFSAKQGLYTFSHFFVAASNLFLTFVCDFILIVLTLLLKRENT